MTAPFRTMLDLKAYIDRMVEMHGLGMARPALDRRGLEVSRFDDLVLCEPADGEKVSPDGAFVYISARLREAK